jgi:hypothetical protein
MDDTKTGTQSLSVAWLPSMIGIHGYKHREDSGFPPTTGRSPGLWARAQKEDDCHERYH